MKITASTIALDSEHASLRAFRGEARLRTQTGSANGARERETRAVVEQLDLGVERYSQLGRNVARVPVANATPASADADALLASGDDLLLIKLLVEILTGRELRVARIDMSAADAASTGSAPPAPAAQPATQFAFDFSFSSHYVEAESTRFRASGTVSTADGQRIDFALDLQMQRRFESSTRIELQAGARKDPLMIDFGGAGPALSSQRMSFDIDGDGSSEQLAAAAGGNAFVALDRNGNGRIDDGGELFGTASGDGFADLAAFDVDGNGFIDEGDPVFAKLLAWQRDAAGNERLDTLAARGVGALYLGRVATPFALRDAGNADLGAVRASGMYINEDGSVGALQQVDLTV